MSKDKKHYPTHPFNEAASNEKEVVFEADFELPDEDMPNLRDNTNPRHEPQNVRHRGLTPSGTTASMFGKPRDHHPQQEEREVNKEPEQDRYAQVSSERQQELLNGKNQCEDEIGGYRVRTTLADYPTEKGLYGGRITELSICTGERGKEAEPVLFRKGDWEKPAKNTQERDIQQSIVEKYDEDAIKNMQKEKAKEAELTQEKNKDKIKFR